MTRPTLCALLALLLVPVSACNGNGGDGQPTAPTATSQAATSIGESGATLNGVVNPSRVATQAWFEYGTAATLGTSSPAQDVGDGSNDLSVTHALSGLTPGTTYYFRVCAQSSAGRTDGEVLSFATAAVSNPPAVVTAAATAIGAAGATLNGTVIANGLATNAWFEWGTDATLATSTATDAQSIGSGMVSQAISHELTGLTAGTRYYYRVAASNAAGTSKGDIVSFLPGAAPTATTLPADPVGQTTATLNATANPNGVATDAWFEWGTSSTLDTFNTSSSQALGDGTTALAVTQALTGLTAGTTYYYRVVASSALGRTSGSIESLTTLPSGYVFEVASTYPANGATGIPLGVAITVTFNHDVEPASLVGAITVAGSTGGEVAGVTSYNATTRTATFIPTAQLAALTQYTVTVDGKVKSAETVRLGTAYVFGFTTAAAP